MVSVAEQLGPPPVLIRSVSVVLSESGKKNEEPTKAIEAFVRERVAAHKRLRGGVHVIDVIPKSASGKILRKDLRAMAAREEQTRAKL